jgi:hypothetical protein
VIFAVIDFLRSAAALTVAFRPVTENLDVEQDAVSYDVFATPIGVPSLCCGEDCSGVVIDPAIFNKPKIVSAKA